MSESTNPSTVEVSSPIGEEIVRHEHGQRSSEGHSEHNRDTAEREAEASRSTKTSDYESDEAFREAFQDAIAQSKPLLSDKDRQANEDREAAKLEREQEKAEAEEAEEQEESEEEEAEEPAGPNPLDAFSADAVAKLAEQLGLSDEDLSNAAVQRLLAARMADQSEITNRVQNPVQQAQQDEQQLSEYLQGLAKAAASPEVSDPRMTQAFTDALSECFGAQTPEAKQNVGKLTGYLTQGGLNLMSTVVPQIMAHYLPDYIEQLLPGLAVSHRDNTYRNVWQDVRGSSPEYADLPDLKTAEFTELYQKIITENPWVDTIEYRDANGRILHKDHPQAVRQAAHLFAKLATGQRLNAETVKKALEKGRQEAQSHARKVTASRSLRAGKSTGASFGRETKDNSFADSINEYMRSQRNSEEY